MIFYGETVPTTRFLLQYTKNFLKRDKIKSFIASKMIDLIKLPDNNGNLAVYTGETIHGLYRYLEMIVDTTTLTTSGQCYNNFGP